MGYTVYIRMLCLLLIVTTIDSKNIQQKHHRQKRFWASLQSVYEKSKETLKDAADAVEENVNNLKDGIEKNVNNLKDTVEENVNDLSHAVGESVNDLSDAVGENVNNLSDAVGENVNDLSDAVGENVNDLSDAVGENVNNLSDAVGENVNNLSDAVGESVNNLSNVVGENVNNLRDAVGENVNNLSNVVGENVNNLKDGIEENVNNLKDAVEENVNHLKEFGDNAMTSLNDVLSEGIENLNDFVSFAKEASVDTLHMLEETDLEFKRSWESLKQSAAEAYVESMHEIGAALSSLSDGDYLDACKILAPYMAEGLACDAACTAASLGTLAVICPVAICPMAISFYHAMKKQASETVSERLSSSPLPWLSNNSIIDERIILAQSGDRKAKTLPSIHQSLQVRNTTPTVDQVAAQSNLFTTPIQPVTRLQMNENYRLQGNKTQQYVSGLFLKGPSNHLEPDNSEPMNPLNTICQLISQIQKQCSLITPGQ